MRRLRTLPHLLLALLLLAGCGGAGDAALTEPRTADRIPAPEEAHAEHYRSFPDTDALAAYLDARSEAGVLISAHRGGPVPGFPENALPTFERSMGFGPMLLEMDLRATADGRILVLHDAELDRTTTGSGPVGEFRLEELRDLRLLGDEGTPEGAWLPTLQEALAWAEGRAILRLDVKRGVTPEMVVAEIREAGAEARVMVIAQGLDEVTAYQALAPELMLSFWHDPDRVGYLTEEAYDALVATDHDPTRFIVGLGSMNAGWSPELLERLRARGIRGMVSTFGELDRAAMEEGAWEGFCPLVEAGVGLLITDAVEAAARAIREC
jgi:glycerophosphoryl diester phosphodiesterase